ncbi:hypothetical protein [Marinomonas flavescens]|uniref:hypothetical protein n=1 Tax=Marinomonas flavescens TaxID=2529379 RepID=UPI001055A08F|nr:hypothetical protein [Marinomonas flavescens]
MTSPRRATLRGSLLLELMVACVLLAVILPLLIPSLWQLRARHNLTLTYLDQAVFESALGAQFKAHWGRLLPAGCNIDNALNLVIGAGNNLPERLSRRSVSSQSDWLEAMDYGACRLSLNTISNPIETPNSCGLNVGDSVRISTCETSVQAQVTLSTSQKLRFDLLNSSVLTQTGILESQAAFYWYVGEGKNTQQALWRTPKSSGNSLELWAGLKALTVLPLIDANQDGFVDSINARYGPYSLNKVRALWVEYLYELGNCKAHAQTPITQRYKTMRGNTWEYLSPCQGVGNQIIVLNSF